MNRRRCRTIEAAAAVLVLGTVFALVWPKFRDAQMIGQVEAKRVCMQSAVDALIAYEVDCGLDFSLFPAAFVEASAAKEITDGRILNATEVLRLSTIAGEDLSQYSGTRLYETNKDPDAAQLTWTLVSPLPGAPAPSARANKIHSWVAASSSKIVWSQGAFFDASNGLRGAGDIDVRRTHKFTVTEPSE